MRPADKDGCAPDDFYSTTNHRTVVRHGGRWIEVDRQRMDAVIVVEDGARGLPQAARRAARRSDRLRQRRHPRHARVPRARPPRLRVHDQRDLVRAPRRGQHRQDRDDDARHQARRRPHRRSSRARSWSTPAAPRTSARSSAAASSTPCCRATRWPCTTSSTRCSARRSASISRPARRSKEGHRNHMRAINTINRAGGIRAAVDSGRPEVGHHVRVREARRAATCSPAASATTGRCPTP